MKKSEGRRDPLESLGSPQANPVLITRGKAPHHVGALSDPEKVTT